MWLPPKVKTELARESALRQAAIGMASHVEATLRRWNTELKQVDPDLQLIKAQANADVPGLKPGFYHLLRVGKGNIPSLIPLEDPVTGEFREPGSWMFDLLRHGDLWDDRVVRDRRQKLDRAMDAQRRARELEAAERQEEILERWKAATMTRVSMNPDAPWTQAVAGRRGASKKKAKAA